MVCLAAADSHHRHDSQRGRLIGERSPSLSFLGPEQVDQVAAHVPRTHRALVYVFAYGGLRWGEAVALRAL